MSKLPRYSVSGLFKTRIGIILFDEVLAMGLMPDFIIGSYLEKNIEIAIIECKKRPDLHIVSMFKDRIINRYVTGAREYFLANGDSDPSLECEKEPVTMEMFRRVKEDILAKRPEDRTGPERFGLLWVSAVIEGADALDPKVVLKIACNDSSETLEPDHASKRH